MPCLTVTAYIALLSSADHLQLCPGASQPTCVLSGLVLLDPILSGICQALSLPQWWLAVAWLQGISCPSPACLPPILLHHLLSHSEQLPVLEDQCEATGETNGCQPGARTPWECSEAMASPQASGSPHLCWRERKHHDSWPPCKIWPGPQRGNTVPGPAQTESWRRIMDASSNREPGGDEEALLGCAHKEGGPWSCCPCWVTGNMHFFTR